MKSLLLLCLVFIAIPVFADMVPDEEQDLPYDAIFHDPVEQDVRAGYAGYNDGNGLSSNPAIEGVFFLEGGSGNPARRTGVFASATLVGGDDGMSFGELDTQVKVTVAIDKKHLFWVGGGVEVDGQISGVDARESFFRAELPVAYAGVLFRVGKTCTVRLFGKLGWGLYDSKTQEGKPWARTTMAGAETMAKCTDVKFFGDVRVRGEAKHFFSFDGEGGTTEISSEVTNYWKLYDRGVNRPPVKAGLFARYKGSWDREEDLNASFEAEAEHVFLGGFQLVF